MKPVRVKSPAVLPASLEELKQAARVDFADDDPPDNLFASSG